MNLLTPHQSKAINISKSISLTANAGSGKTLVLAHRYLEIILHTSTPIGKVAAITFTEKAAGELYKKISTELNKLLLTNIDNVLREKIERVRKQLVSARISTIHSFCIDLLKEFPVEASVDANFIPVNEQKTFELLDLSIEKVIREMLGNPEQQSDIKSLIRLLGSKANLKRELANLVSKRKNIFYHEKLINSLSESEFAGHLFQLFREQLNIILDIELHEFISGLKKLNEAVLTHVKSNDIANSVNTILTQLEHSDDATDKLILLKKLGDLVLTQNGEVRKRSYLDSSLRQHRDEEISVVENFFNQLNEIDTDENHGLVEVELARYSKVFMKVFRQIHLEFENKKNELGVLDFEDILLKTKELLGVKSVQKSLFKKFDYILVDEYQDTNEIQYEIFLPLVDYLKTGNLFIVGDEKQSIYRFRDADLKVFSETKSDIKKFHGDDSLLSLPDSFRMAPAICLFVNKLFRNLFKNPQSIYNEVEHSDLICARSDNFGGKVEFLIASDDNESLSGGEAELVARRIIKLKLENKDRLTEWNKIAVLVRKRASFTELQKAFIKYRIPFNIVGGTGYYQQQSISDIYNYFAFLFNHKDDGALIGILRSPFFFVSDTQIFRLSFFEGETYWDKLHSAALKDISWRKIYDLINENIQLLNKISVPVLLRKILSETGFVAAIASRPDSDQQLSNLNKLISETIGFFNEGFNTLYDYISFLNSSITKSEDEAQAEIEKGKAGVNLLTIHQAKGLEFTAVFLYKCDDTTPSVKIKSRSITIDKDFGLLTKVPINDDFFGTYYSAPVVGIYNFIETKKEYAELKRLLYVGLTRAEDFLFISQTANGESFRRNSFSGLISEGLNIDFKKNFVNIEGDLTFLLKEENNYSNITRNINLEIPITSDIQIEQEIEEKSSADTVEKEFLISEIKDHSKGEVISATRFAAYSDCPLKYNLLYNYKLGELVGYSKDFVSHELTKEEAEYNRNESVSVLLDDKSGTSELMKLKGRIIHAALQKNIQALNIENFIAEQLRSFSGGINTSSYSDEIKNELLKFYSSGEYKFLDSFKSFKNEFEVYLKESDYYLFGIIDKIIFDKQKVIIVDYKTDNITDTQIITSGIKYLPQVKFYSYIVKRLFEKKSEIEGRVVFIKNPDTPFIFKYDEEADAEIKSGIYLMVQSIRNNNYSLNLDHCKSCMFADENSVCIKNRAEKPNKHIQYEKKN